MTHDCMIGKPDAMEKFSLLAEGLTADVIAKFQGHCQKELSNIIVLFVCQLGDLFEMNGDGVGGEFVHKIGDALVRSADNAVRSSEFSPPPGTTLQ